MANWSCGIYNPVSVQYSGSRARHERVKLITHVLARGHNDSLYGFIGEGRLADSSCARDIPATREYPISGVAETMAAREDGGRLSERRSDQWESHSSWGGKQYVIPRTSARDIVLFALKWINARHAGTDVADKRRVTTCTISRVH